MSAKARATICAPMSCCASRSPSARSPARSRTRSPALANRPAPQQPRQKADRGEQRMPPLPWLQANLGAGVAVDLPRDVIGASSEGQARLGEADDRKRFALELQ